MFWITNRELIIHVLSPSLLKLFILKVLNVFVNVLDIWHAKILHRLRVIRITIIYELFPNALRVFTWSSWLHRPSHNFWHWFARVSWSYRSRVERNGTTDSVGYVWFFILYNLNIVIIELAHEFTVFVTASLSDLSFDPKILSWTNALSIGYIQCVVSQNSISDTKAEWVHGLLIVASLIRLIHRNLRIQILSSQITRHFATESLRHLIDLRPVLDTTHDEPIQVFSLT